MTVKNREIYRRITRTNVTAIFNEGRNGRFTSVQDGEKKGPAIFLI